MSVQSAAQRIVAMIHDPSLNKPVLATDVERIIREEVMNEVYRVIEEGFTEFRRENGLEAANQKAR